LGGAYASPEKVWGGKLVKRGERKVIGVSKIDKGKGYVSLEGV